MAAASEKMAELMDEENGEQREGKGKAGGESGGLSIEERHALEEFVDGSGFVARESVSELRAGNEASAKGNDEEDARDD
jgi:hypothetical protein